MRNAGQAGSVGDRMSKPKQWKQGRELKHADAWDGPMDELTNSEHREIPPGLKLWLPARLVAPHLR